MTLKIIHNGKALTQEQLDAITEPLISFMNEEVSEDEFKKAVDEALAALEAGKAATRVPVNIKALADRARALTPETENMHLFGDGEYAGRYDIPISPTEKMRDIVVNYLGLARDESEWDDGEHAMYLGALETFNTWLNGKGVLLSKETVLSLTDEVEQLRKVVAGFLFNYDDGVGKPWEQSLLDHARTLCQPEEFKAEKQ